MLWYVTFPPQSSSKDYASLTLKRYYEKNGHAAIFVVSLSTVYSMLDIRLEDGIQNSSRNKHYKFYNECKDKVLPVLN
jgi:uncharacterized protein (UPF0254 family)